MALFHVRTQFETCTYPWLPSNASGVCDQTFADFDIEEYRILRTIAIAWNTVLLLLVFLELYGTVQMSVDRARRYGQRTSFWRKLRAMTASSYKSATKLALVSLVAMNLVRASDIRGSGGVIPPPLSLLLDELGNANSFVVVILYALSVTAAVERSQIQFKGRFRPDPPGLQKYLLTFVPGLYVVLAFCDGIPGITGAPFFMARSMLIALYTSFTGATVALRILPVWYRVVFSRAVEPLPVTVGGEQLTVASTVVLSGRSGGSQGGAELQVMPSSGRSRGGGLLVTMSASAMSSMSFATGRSGASSQSSNNLIGSGGFPSVQGPPVGSGSGSGGVASGGSSGSVGEGTGLLSGSGGTSLILSSAPSAAVTGAVAVASQGTCSDTAASHRHGGMLVLATVTSPRGEVTMGHAAGLATALSTDGCTLVAVHAPADPAVVDDPPASPTAGSEHSEIFSATLQGGRGTRVTGTTDSVPSDVFALPSSRDATLSTSSRTESAAMRQATAAQSDSTHISANLRSHLSFSVVLAIVQSMVVNAMIIAIGVFTFGFALVNADAPYSPTLTISYVRPFFMYTSPAGVFVTIFMTPLLCLAVALSCSAVAYALKAMFRDISTCGAREPPRRRQPRSVRSRRVAPAALHLPPTATAVSLPPAPRYTRNASGALVLPPLQRSPRVYASPRVAPSPVSVQMAVPSTATAPEPPAGSTVGRLPPIRPNETKVGTALRNPSVRSARPQPGVTGVVVSDPLTTIAEAGGLEEAEPEEVSGAESDRGGGFPAAIRRAASGAGAVQSPHWLLS